MKRRNFIAISISIFLFPINLFLPKRRKIIVKEGWFLKEEDISCPNFFKIKNKWVLLCISHTHGCRCYIGKWNKKSEIFIPEKHVRMNWPNNQDSKYYLEHRDFFAPESVETLDGRRVMWSWMRMQNIKNFN